jgi:N-formylglutamate amidohydrolase
VLIAVPHAGRDYPPALLRRLRHPDDAPHRLEDRLVDLVAEGVARETGAALLIARAPRAMIDLNRSPEDVDWTMVTGGGGSPIRTRLAAGRRASSGLGLVPRRLPGLGELWHAPLDRSELSERIEAIHQPYHATLGQMLEVMRDRWGAALLLDLHSMPPLGPKTGDDPAVDYVIGDRFGGSCDNRLVTASFEHFEHCRARAAHNRPYAGGYVLDRHGVPGRGISAMQLEICRTAYLDRDLRHQGPGLDDTVRVVAGLVRRLAGEISGFAGGIAEAAE